ncbi:LppX_LprAFG lipoprotein [Mycolicibacterium arenosum]|uniref:LppX_LprAFG lipoprotein n=1 Tax=Mycolicibacterium arenosum TaxID=2952157 RepID=A0ABT1M0V2_9MYCO|nr:LppX_LprAFG lipoprotein [Mycolicibacterium sp. CAU 1645]MCP9272783.1 LppX_LprAFG lipoprotein [Mycolicibacterium sp. CAU 1645]
MRPRFAVLFSALLATVLLFAGCSSSSTSTADLPEPATLLSDSQKSTAALKSVHLELAVTGTIEGLPIESLSGDLANEPAVAAQGKATIIFLGQKVEDVEFVVADGVLYGALTPGSWTDFGPASDIYDVSAILNPEKGLANILANMTDPKNDSVEEINGVETVKVTGTVSADAVNKIAPDIKATAPVPGTAWVKTDGDHALVQAQLDISEGNSVQMTLSKWDEPVTVTKPAV